VWSQTGAKQTPSFRVHCPRRMKISVVVVIWLDKWVIKEGNVEVTDCKPSLFSCPLCFKFYLEQPGLTHLPHSLIDQPINAINKIQFMTGIKILYVSALGCHPQGVF
jgi:hypothetical protein